MRSPLRARCGVSIIAVLGVTLLPFVTFMAPALAAEQPPQLRVMFVGDSITQGRQGDATLRYFVWREFSRQRVPVTFVGPNRSLSRIGRDRSRYLRTDAGFETAHAARSGARLEGQGRLIAERVKIYQPHVVSVGLGFNGTGSSTPATLEDRTHGLLEKVWAVDPNIEIVLSEITMSSRPSFVVSGGRNDVARAANALVARRYADDPRVTLAHDSTASSWTFRPKAHTFDGVHPNVTGQRVLAFHIATALKQAGALPGPVARPSHEVWDVRPRVRKVRVRVGGRTTLAWPHEASRTAATSLRVSVRGGGQGLMRRRTSATTKKVVLTLSPGLYRARLRVVRGSMVSTPGPVRRFRVR